MLCEMTINSEPVDALSFVAHKTKVQRQGRDMAERLKKVGDSPFTAVTT